MQFSHGTDRALGPRPGLGTPVRKIDQFLSNLPQIVSSGLGGMQVTNKAPLATRHSCELGEQVLAQCSQRSGLTVTSGHRSLSCMLENSSSYLGVAHITELCCLVSKTFSSLDCELPEVSPKSFLPPVLSDMPGTQKVLKE